MEKIIILCAVFMVVIFLLVFIWKHQNMNDNRKRVPHHNHKIGHKHGEDIQLIFMHMLQKSGIGMLNLKCIYQF